MPGSTPGTDGTAIAMADDLELLDLTHRMLDAIHTGNYEAYQRMCLDDVSCYETDVAPYRIDGLEFHLDLIREMGRHGTYEALIRFDMLTPRVQAHGDTGIVTYTRLMTYMGEAGPRWSAFNETRVFVREDGVWRMAHFHRSAGASAP
jgi:ketosteroid isomerase-like protein